jgi:hypothetical protein
MTSHHMCQLHYRCATRITTTLATGQPRRAVRNKIRDPSTWRAVSGTDKIGRTSDSTRPALRCGVDGVRVFRDGGLEHRRLPGPAIAGDQHDRSGARYDLPHLGTHTPHYPSPKRQARRSTVAARGHTRNARASQRASRNLSV